MPSNQVWGAVFDNHLKLWISTSKGLVKYDPERETVENTFYESDGLPSNEFNYFSFSKSSTGSLYFGTKNGFTRFNPENIRINPYRPRGIITNITVNNQPLEISSEGFLKKHISFLPEITLDHHQEVFTLGFSSSNHWLTDETQFEYQMAGVDRDWVKAKSDRRFTTYTNLDPGYYQFRLKAANDDGVWSVTPIELNIRIQAAPWNTPLAKLLYIIFAFGVLYFIYGEQRTRWLLKTNLAVERQEAIRLKELSAFKNTFFTNLTHEIRTPLTVILGMTESLTEKSKHSLKRLKN
ncbi:MAG: hypothetical protein IPL46_19930 [Saprospiraceae bacterium]|nr:hypothetical protein [Saprospiraceae bacterium]